LKKRWIHQLIFVLIVLSLSTLLSFAFEQLQLRKENILLVYIASIILIIVQTKSTQNGLISTFFLVFIFNFFFTEPKFTFLIDDVNYIITLVIFVITIVIIGSQTAKLQYQINYAKTNALKIELLYHLSNDLHHAKNRDETIYIMLDAIKGDINRNLCFYDLNDQLLGDPLIEEHQKQIVRQMIKEQINGGAYELVHRELGYKVLIIQSKERFYGALCIDCLSGDLSKEDEEFIQTVILLVSGLLDQEHSREIEQISKLEFEKERFKTMLLRSISHDLRTPLTTLQTGLSFLEESFFQIDDKNKLTIIKDLYDESAQLSVFIENILYMTRLSSKNQVLHIKQELIGDIFNEAKERTQHRLGQHQLTIENVDDAYIEVDGQLIVQVLVNLIDNAIAHTKNDSIICLSFASNDEEYIIEVVDNGGGIPPDHLAHIFDDYQTFQHHSGDMHRGIGLGLSICKSILNAHMGSIEAVNNDIGGATFRLVIPKTGGVQEHE